MGERLPTIAFGLGRRFPCLHTPLHLPWPFPADVKNAGEQCTWDESVGGRGEARRQLGGQAPGMLTGALWFGLLAPDSCRLAETRCSYN